MYNIMNSFDYKSNTVYQLYTTVSILVLDEKICSKKALGLKGLINYCIMVL